MQNHNTEQEQAEVIAMPGIRSRMAAYQQTTKKKKSTHTAITHKKKKVGKLQQKLRDPGQFESAAAEKQAKQVKPVFQVKDGEAAIEEVLQLDGRIEVPEPDSEEELEDTPLAMSSSPTKRSKPAVVVHVVTTPLSPMQAPVSPAKPSEQPHGHNNNDDGTPVAARDSPKEQKRSNDRDHSNNNSNSSLKSLQHPPTQVELEARSRLNTLLQREMRDQKTANSYDVCRVRYLRAVGKLRPQDYYGEGHDSFRSDAPTSLSMDLIKKRRETRRTEREKKGRYDKLKQSWYTYEDVATDRPLEMTPEDEEIQKDLDEIEEEIHEEWEDFAEDVVRAAEEDKEAGIVTEEEDADIQEWREETKKLKKDAEIRRLRKQDRERKRQARIEEKRRRQVAEAARKRREEEARLEKEAKEKAEKKAKEKAEREEKERLERQEQQRKEREETERDVTEEPDEAVEDSTSHVDADNEQEEEDARRGKKGKTKCAEDDDETSTDVEESNSAMLNPFASMGMAVMGEERPKTIKQDTSSHQPSTEESGTETSASHSESVAGGTETGESSLAVMTDIALSPKRGKKAAHGKLPGEGDKLNGVKYFDDGEDDEQEEDILPNVDKDKKRRKSKLQKEPAASPAAEVAADNGHKRKKKELRIEYDNGIPKDITIIINNLKGDKRKDKRRGKDVEIDEDDVTLSDVSESEFSSDESETESSVSKKKPLPKKPVVLHNSPKKGARNQKNKHDVMRIDTLPNNQFYDGTEESPFLAWTHRPLKCKIDGSQIMVKVPPRTDCWRKTRHNFIMDNAPFYWHRVNGDFEVMVKVSGDMKKMYDKAGIMIRLDAENWIVSGLEYFNNELNHMTCVTRDYTDWSMAPISADAKSQGAWICIKRIGNAYESFCSMDGRNWRQARQGLFTDATSVRVGIFCACPMGENFKVTFDKYRCKNLSF